MTPPLPRATGRRASSDETKKEGTYIWHTVGDNRVRSSHADRDGKTFSWTDPPEGGHPKEAPGCRCWAENVEEKKQDCEKIKWEIRAAWQRHDALSEPIVIAKIDVNFTQKVRDDLKKKLNEAKSQLATGAPPGNSPGKGKLGRILGGASLVLTAADVARQIKLINELDEELEKWERALVRKKEKWEMLKCEKKKHGRTAEDYTRRYEHCKATKT